MFYTSEYVILRFFDKCGCKKKVVHPLLLVTFRLFITFQDLYQYEWHFISNRLNNVELTNWIWKGNNKEQAEIIKKKIQLTFLPAYKLIWWRINKSHTT